MTAKELLAMMEDKQAMNYTTKDCVEYILAKEIVNMNAALEELRLQVDKLQVDRLKARI